MIDDDSYFLPNSPKYSTLLNYTEMFNPSYQIVIVLCMVNFDCRGPRTHSMPNWIRILFLKYLPVFLFMRRPKKTRLRWMMEIPGTSRKIPTGPPPTVMTSSGPGLMGNPNIPDGGPGLHGVSPPGYSQVNMPFKRLQ